MLAWDDLRYALALYRHGRMNSAAQSLGINVATMSRRIERLGEKIGQPLFIKKADGWQPCPSVNGLLRLAEDIEQRLETEFNRMMAGDGGHNTTLSIGCPPIISLFVLYPNLGNRAPELSKVNYSFTQRVLEDGLGENDVALQYKRPSSGRVITQKITTLVSSIYQHRSAGPEDTGWISLGEQYDATPLNQAAFTYFPQPPAVRVESMYELYELLGATRMAGPMLDFVARSNPDLVPVPGGERLVELDFWMIYHASRKGDPVMEATLAWIKDSFARMQRPSAQILNMSQA